MTMVAAELMCDMLGCENEGTHPWSVLWSFCDEHYPPSSNMVCKGRSKKSHGKWKAVSPEEMQAKLDAYPRGDANILEEEGEPCQSESGTSPSLP